MRKGIFIFAAVTMSVILAASCQKDRNTCSQGEGTLVVKFTGNPRELSKASAEMPDTNDFFITVTSSDGKTVYDGLYCNIPESFSVSSGSCRIYVRSEDFDKPQFDRPQFGDDRCVVVPSGGVVQAELECLQLNAGIRLQVAPEFLDEYPQGVLWLKSGSDKLMYSYREKRIAYFKPGNVSVVLAQDGNEETLLTRGLAAQEVLSLKISLSPKQPSSSQGKGGITISLDTSRIWSNESFVIGGKDNKGATAENAFTVNQAKVSVGRNDVWISGFIVGGNLTSSGISFDGPFKSNSNIAIAGRRIAGSRESCMAVQLSAGKVRDAINLVDHPELLGREVLLNGDIVESYFGLVGLKNVSDFIIR